MTGRQLVVVTGAAGGIGGACVRVLSERYDVLATDVREPSDRGPADSWVTADIVAPEGRAAVVDAVGDRPLWAVAHLAGITRDALLTKLPDEDVLQVLRVNAGAPIRLSLALADRIQAGGTIVFVSSRAHLGNIGQVNYAASKGALVGATHALARSLAPRVRVNAIAPGLIATPMTAAMPPDVLGKLVARIPLGRIGEGDDVARALAFLVSEEAAYMTAQTVYVCGGRSR